jgi:predicted thioesterase
LKDEEIAMQDALVPGFTRIRPPGNAPAADISVTADPRAMFATAFLAGLVEWACIESLAPYLPAGWQTMGTHITLSHAGPASADIRTKIELVDVTGDVLRFRFACFSGADWIGSGFHERRLIRAAQTATRLVDQSRVLAA